MKPSIEKADGLLTYLAAARHRRRWLMAAFAFGLTVTILLGTLLPPHFRSAGTILIEQQEMPQELVRSTVTSYADERVQVISKRVMTTETLLGIIRRYDLYPEQRAKDTREALLKQMRKDIGLKMISADVIDPRSGHPTSATIAFEVSYTSDSADLAAKVANELTTLYLNENLNNRTQLARDAATFLESEGDRLNHRIGELEAQLAKFKDQHFHQLPELTQLNMQLLDHTDEELRGQEAHKASLEQQRVYLEAQLVQLKPNSTVFSETGERIVSSTDRLKMARSQLDSARASYGLEHPDVVRLERQVAGLEKEIAASSKGKPAEAAATPDDNDLRRKLESAQASLAAAVGRYSPEHPDRVRLQREVDSLQAQLAAAPTPTSAPASTTAAGTTAIQQTTPKDADNPAYVQIQAQLAATINDLNALDDQIAKLRARSNELQKNITLAPQVEQQYRELSRDYDNTRLKYQEIRSKQSEAKTAQNLEADRKGERFTLIDPPLPPEEPVSPNRKLIFAAGLILSVGLAAAVLWLLEKFDTSVRGRLDLLELTGLPPLALVPHIATEFERRAGRRRMRLAIGSAMASLCIAIALTHFFYRPLDVLWFTFSRRMGF
jgi:succinoglycan biosynthesis transport protein ExoP